MQAKIFTLRYSATLGGFDDSALELFTRDREVLAFREHFFSVSEVPHLACVVTWQDQVISETDLEAARRCAPRQTDGPRPPSNGSREKRDRSDPTEGLDAAGRALFNTLRGWRMEKAKDEGVPPYLIFTNRHLVELVTKRPRSPAALGQLPGIGPGKINRYGQQHHEGKEADDGSPSGLLPITGDNGPSEETSGTPLVRDGTSTTEGHRSAAGSRKRPFRGSPLIADPGERPPAREAGPELLVLAKFTG